MSQSTSPRQAIFRNEEIEQLIPQRVPIIMVDKFFGIEENRSYSGLTVRSDNLFCETEGLQEAGKLQEVGRLQEAGIIEHIAQSAAARIGYLYLLKKEEVPLGFIGSVDKLKLHALPEVGTELFTEITVVQEVFDITLIAATVKAVGQVKDSGGQVQDSEQVIAECQMKIFIKKE